MPRTGRGGSRQGTPGTAYKNRTDLAADRQPVRAPAGQTYGERGQQEQAQRQVPLPDIAAHLAALPALTAPSSRPDEPLTAGLPFGPGPGPTNMAPGTGAAGLIRRMVAAGNTDPVLMDLLAEAERTEGPRAMIPATSTPMGSHVGDSAGWQGLPIGGHVGRIANREVLQARSGSPDTAEG